MVAQRCQFEEVVRSLEPRRQGVLHDTQRSSPGTYVCTTSQKRFRYALAERLRGYPGEVRGLLVTLQPWYKRRSSGKVEVAEVLLPPMAVFLLLELRLVPPCKRTAWHRKKFMTGSHS